MESTGMVVWGLLFGAAGIGYFTYGRRQDNKVALLAGIALLVYPYFVSSAFAMIGLGCVLLALPFFVEL